MNDRLFARPLTDNHTVKCGRTSIGSDSGRLQKCKKSAAFKSRLLSVVIYGYPPSRNISTPLANDPESPCEQCFKAGQECFSWKGWACYNCRLKKIQCSVHIYNRWKREMNAHLQSSELQGTKKPPKGASAKESSCKKASKQRKTNCAAEDDAKLRDKGKGKAVDKASKVRQQGMFF